MGSGGSVPSVEGANRSNVGSNDTPEEEPRPRSSIFLEGPTDSQGPSPYATLRRDETWWQRGPSAPSLPRETSGTSDPFDDGSCPDGINDQSETLLTYTAHMTGWHNGVGIGTNKYLEPSRNEAMELSRTVSCLATANQQLATAHASALAHLEALYHELRATRLSQIPQSRDEDEEKTRTRLYVEKLEAMLVERGTIATEIPRDRRSRCQAESTLTDEDQSRTNVVTFAVAETQTSSECARSNVESTELPLRNELSERVEREKNEEESRTVVPEPSEKCITRTDESMEMKDEEMTESKSIDETRENCNEMLQKQCNGIDRLDQSDGLPEDPGPTETARLVEELEASRAETDLAKLKIASLEQELRKSTAERDHARCAEGQKSAKLRAQLAEEVSDKKRQIKALEDALEEIQRLKLAVKNEARDNATGVEAVGASHSEGGGFGDTVDDTVDGNADSDDTLDVRPTNLEEFKKELTLKREARQRAIAAVSSEMDRLRRELGAEREAHSETTRVLDLLKSAESRKIRDEERIEDTEESLITDKENEVLRRLEQELQDEKEAHRETMRRMTARRMADAIKVSDELRSLIYHEAEKLDDLRYNLERDGQKHEQRILQLKEAVTTTRTTMKSREKQVNRLKDQLAQIMARLDPNGVDLSTDDTGTEFDHQVENLRSLKALYEIRLKIIVDLGEHATSQLHDARNELQISRKKCKAVEEDLKKMEEKVDVQDTEISNLESQLGLTKADCRDLENQMSVINSLFTQMLLSASSADMDLDKLTRLLQENHDLISDMAREEGTEAAALPKLLLDLVEQVEGRKNEAQNGNADGGEKREEGAHEENIAHNLPKVWRVLLELLSCHAVETPSTSASDLSDPESCYKSVDTPTGPQLVISVSKTYIRLKELILEKKQLEKEMTRMKQLNTHLESKLGEQEKRLSTVSTELSKTWNIVGRMQAQHQQLHTHEKILRYELQQKRKMLQELKQELEYCREKWESARQKNTNTEIEWKSLRREFAARKALAVHDSLNNSGESGFSDERGDESDEEDDIATERIRISPRRRTRKEGPRVPTPDTESEQPTDTELSSTAAMGSTETLEQRTPTPETETETETEIEGETLVCDDKSGDVEPVASPEPRPASPEPERSPETEILDPLDRALTNVIQSLIRIDGVTSPSTATTSLESIAIPSTSSATMDTRGRTTTEVSSDCETKRRNSKRKDTREWSPRSEPWSSSPSSLWKSRNKRVERGAGSFTNDSSTSEEIASETMTVTPGAVTDHCTNICSDDINQAPLPDTVPLDEQTSTSMESTPTASIFSIGPYPSSKSPSPMKSVQFKEPLVTGPSGTDFLSTFGQSTPSDEAVPSTSSHEAENYTQTADNEAILAVDNTNDHRSDKAVIDNCDSPKKEELDGGSSFEPPLTGTTKMTKTEVPSAESDVVEARSENKPRESSTISTESRDVEYSTTVPSTSRIDVPSTPSVTRTPEEVLAARAARLKRLEEQADWLMKKMNATSQRGSALSSRLEELHDTYGEPPAPPPLPDVLPTVRIRTSLRGEHDLANHEDEQTRQPESRELSVGKYDSSRGRLNESPSRDNAP